MKITIKGVTFPVETQEEADFIREETEGKDWVDVSLIKAHWLRACSYPTENADTVVEGQNG